MSSTKTVMECQNMGEIVWTLKLLRKPLPDDDLLENIRLSECRFELLGGAKWKWTVRIKRDGLFADLERECRDEGPKEINVALDMGMMTIHGENWRNRIKRRKLFEWSDSCRFMRLCDRKQLSDSSRNFYVSAGTVRMSLRMWPLPGVLFPRSTKLVASSSAGTEKIELCRVTCLLRGKAMKDRRFRNCDFQGFLLHAYPQDDKVSVILSSYYVHTVLLTEVRIGRLGGVKKLFWNGNRLVHEKARVELIDDYCCFDKLHIPKDAPPEFVDCIQLEASLKFVEFSVCHAEMVDRSTDVSASTPGKRSCSNTPPVPHTSNKSTSTESPPEKKDASVNVQSSNTGVSSPTAKNTSEIPADFTLQVNGDSIRVHKNVLIAASTVFKALFMSLPSSQNAIEVPDYHVDSVRRMVRYIYTSAVPDLEPSNAPELFSLADRYGLLSLRNLCLRVLLSPGMSPQTVCSILSLAGTHWIDDAKRQALAYISLCPRRVFASTEWTEFMKKEPVLALEVYHDLYRKKLKCE